MWYNGKPNLVHTLLFLPETWQSKSSDKTYVFGLCVCVAVEVPAVRVCWGCVGGQHCWWCVKIKLINLVFISWHCLCLPHSHFPTKRHRGANNHPAMLQTAPQAQCTRRVLGADQGAKSGLITSFTPVFTNSSSWPLQATVSIDHMHMSCHTVKTLVCSRVFGMPACIFLPQGARPACAARMVRRLKPKVRMTLALFQNVQQERCIEGNPKTVFKVVLWVLLLYILPKLNLFETSPAKKSP